MARFGRRFDVAILADWDRAHPGNAVRALFERWALPGRYHRSAPLRVGVRDGYLNLYVKGQSVAKLSAGRKGPRLATHRAYATLTRWGDGLPTGEGERDYVTHDAAALATAALAEAIPDWIATALTYASPEKHFVDDLIRANANVIDLEMGLPAIDAPGAARVAPRMDLVIVRNHHSDTDRLALNFWEAKLASNGELRARSDYLEEDGDYRAGPKVIAQLRKYQTWMEHDGHAAAVAAAYRATGAVLADLYAIFGSKHEVTPEPVTMWRRLAVCERIDVVMPPGVVIANTLPDSYSDKGDPAASKLAAELKRAEESFGKHRQSLERHGITVHSIGTNDAWAGVGAHLAFLPPLEPGVVTA